MDYKTSLVTGITCIVLGLYFFTQGFRMAILRKEVLIFITKFYIWLNFIVNGKSTADKYRAYQLRRPRQLIDGISYIIIGFIVLVLGTLLLVSL